MNSHDLFEQIAKEHLGIQTLQTRKSDSLDFHEVSVWQLEAALKAAYEAGQQSRQQVEQPKKQPRTRP